MTRRLDEPALAAIELIRVQLPLRRPLRSGHGIERERDLILIRAAYDDGVEGWGECSALALPTYTHEYTAGAWTLLRDVLAPAALAGDEIGVVGHPMARAGLAGAMADAGQRRRGQRLVEHLGAIHGRPAHSVATTGVVGRGGEDGIDEVLTEVAAVRDGGAVMVKLKVTPHPDDLAAVAAVRATWPDLVMAVDGNGTLDLRSLAILDGHGLAYVEQPAPADALLELAAMAKRTAAPICLDESITSLATLDVALALGAVQVVNIKPARLGGTGPAAALARHAAEAGCRTFVGGMLESGVGRAGALAVAALPACAVPTDLGPSARYFGTDLTAPIVADASGRLVVPTGPGLGVEPDRNRLSEATVDRTVVSRP